jgi:hypothetical protein
MDKTILDMIEGGLKPELMFTLCQLLLAAYLVMFLRNRIINELAWRQFKCSLVIGINTRVRLATSSGHVDGQIISASRTSIKVETEDAIVYIPTKEFSSTSWVVLK